MESSASQSFRTNAAHESSATSAVIGQVRRRWSAFRLQTLLIAVTLLAIVMAWVSYHRALARRDQEIDAQLLRSDVWAIHFDTPFVRYESGPRVKPRAGWQRYVDRLLGRRAVAVSGGYLCTDLGPLTEFTALQMLDVGSFRLADITPLARLPSLRKLNLQSQEIKSLAPLANLTQLEELDCHGTGVRDLAPLANLQRLERLCLGETPVSDLKPLSGLQNLRRLELQRTQVRDLSPLHGLKQLSVVCLHETPASAAEIARLQSALPSCHIDADPLQEQP